MSPPDDPKATALEFRDLHHAYQTTKAVDGVSLSVDPGELVCLLGPSGCGKSTTLRLVAGLERPLQGEILIDGEVVANDQIFLPPEHRRTGLVFQDFALFPHLNVLDNVLFGLRRLEANAAQTRALATLTQVGMEGFVEKFPNTLSGGEQQRVALARALAPHPHLMLMDEPFSGLDRRLRDRIRDETLALLKAEQAATLLVTHDPDEALRMADKIALMRRGKFVQVGSPKDLYDRPVDLGTAAFFSDVNIFHGKIEAGGMATPFGNIPAFGLADGSKATLAFRLHAVEIAVVDKPVSDTGIVQASVKRTRMLGEKGLVEFTLQGLETDEYAAHVEPQGLPEPGSQIGLRLGQEARFIFGGHQSL
jgi:iron(III) transport system ATP-binding protein